MKNLILLISVLIFPIIMYSQVYEDWSAPVALTDTQSYNANPVIVSIPEDGNGDTFMFYEKNGSPEANRQIWWRRISDDMGEEQMFIGAWPEVDYRNPQVLEGHFLIYECNVYGNYDLFGVKFDETGISGNIFQLTNTAFDENSFLGVSYYSQHCCWESEGNINLATIEYNQDTLLFADLAILDTGDCSNPVYNQSFVAWQKMVNNESHIYYSEKTYPLYEWTEPDIIYATGNNLDLSISRSILMEGWNLCWENTDQIYFCETFGSNPLVSSPEIPGIENYFEPTAFDLLLITDYLPSIYSFAGESNAARDIYIVDHMFSSDPINITEDEFVNKNPRLFSGRLYGYFYEVLNIWQTEINGYDVLFKSQATYLLGDVNENSDDRFKIKSLPNPFTDQTTLSFYTSSKEVVTINIYNTFGEIVQDEEISNLINGRNEFVWKPKKELAKGLYYVEIRQGDLNEIIKIIWTN